MHKKRMTNLSRLSDYPQGLFIIAENSGGVDIDTVEERHCERSEAISGISNGMYCWGDYFVIRPRNDISKNVST